MTHIQDKTIVFQAFAGKIYGCSPRAIYEVMLRDPRFDDFTFIWVFQDVDRHDFLLQDARTRIVHHESAAYYEAFRHAKYWVVNHMIPLTITKLPGQVMIQCWHGTPLKKLRTDISEDSVIPDSASDILRKNSIDTRRYDYFISPSRYASKHFTEAFRLDAPEVDVEMLEVGYPRNDYLATFTGSDALRIKKELGIPQDKKVLLYAPTWRDDQYDANMEYRYEPAVDFAALQRSLGDSYVVLFRLHTYITETLNLKEYAGFIYDVSHVDNINELYIVSDILVTDYSSVFFDFANLKRPILFYMYDKDHYQQELRGFYLPVSELPGDIVTTQSELVERLQDFEAYQERTKQRIAAFHDTYNYLDDGRASERVIDSVWGKSHNAVDQARNVTKRVTVE